jgi:hypothetical protein
MQKQRKRVITISQNNQSKNSIKILKSHSITDYYKNPSLGGQMHLSFGHKASNTEITPSRWMDREHQSLEKVREIRFEENYDPKGNYLYFDK